MRRRIRFQSLMLLAASTAAAVGVGLAGATGSAWLFVGGLAATIVAGAIGWQLAALAQALETCLERGERLRLLGQVSGGLAHQLRNGVAGANLAVQLHARSCDGDSKSLDAARRQLARIESDLSRFLDLGRQRTARRLCHILELLEEAMALVRPQFRDRDVQLCWEPPIVDPVVHADTGRLGHIVVNLLTNAVEAAGPGGQVEITLEQTAKGSCIIEVWDSGDGISPAVASRLFQPFVTGKSGGVGLGLFVARQAAEAHGGRLEWRRQRGMTCFRLELPTAEVEEARERVSEAVPG